MKFKDYLSEAKIDIKDGIDFKRFLQTQLDNIEIFVGRDLPSILKKFKMEFNDNMYISDIGYNNWCHMEKNDLVFNINIETMISGTPEDAANAKKILNQDTYDFDTTTKKIKDLCSKYDMEYYGEEQKVKKGPCVFIVGYKKKYPLNL